MELLKVAILDQVFKNDSLKKEENLKNDTNFYPKTMKCLSS